MRATAGSSQVVRCTRRAQRCSSRPSRRQCCGSARSSLRSRCMSGLRSSSTCEPSTPSRWTASQTRTRASTGNTTSKRRSGCRSTQAQLSVGHVRGTRSTWLRSPWTSSSAPCVGPSRAPCSLTGQCTHSPAGLMCASMARRPPRLSRLLFYRLHPSAGTRTGASRSFCSTLSCRWRQATFSRARSPSRASQRTSARCTST
mmetsp:Transcript_5381/g.13781  ORF Transcript_5381/g.13781 Transcript_5381/m.13781 type:complete len:201 (-) Transcript_5381:334-936(-)